MKFLALGLPSELKIAQPDCAFVGGATVDVLLKNWCRTVPPNARLADSWREAIAAFSISNRFAAMLNR